MGNMEEIQKFLRQGRSAKEIIAAGYRRSTVFAAQQKLRDAQQLSPGMGVNDAVADLRRRREIIRLENEIAELEAGKEKLSDRLTALESRLTALETSYGSLFDSHCRLCVDLRTKYNISV